MAQRKQHMSCVIYVDFDLCSGAAMADTFPLAAVGNPAAQFANKAKSVGNKVCSRLPALRLLAMLFPQRLQLHSTTSRVSRRPLPSTGHNHAGQGSSGARPDRHTGRQD